MLRKPRFFLKTGSGQRGLGRTAAVEVFVFDGHGPAGAVFPTSAFYRVLHGVLPGAGEEFGICAGHVNAREGEVEGGLVDGVVVGLNQLLRLSPVFSAEAFKKARFVDEHLKNRLSSPEQSVSTFHVLDVRLRRVAANQFRKGGPAMSKRLRERAKSRGSASSS